MKIPIAAGRAGEGPELDEAEQDETLDDGSSHRSGVQHRHDAAEDPFGQNFHRMFDSFFSGKHPFFCPDGRAWNPPTDIFETDDALHVKIEVAGLRERDIEVKINREYLVIRGRRADSDRMNNARFHLMEIHYGSFERVVRLPHPVELKRITATLENGFLKVHVPKDSNVTEYHIVIE